ncbi:MAG: LTA synthase family protein [Sphingomonadales bacterium]|nr:LTA synthase family protein [Sphingomonadales bacterium]
MLKRLRISKTLLWVANLLLIFLLLFSLFRIFIFFQFRPARLPQGEVLSAFLLGLRYDLRWIAIVLLPIIALSIHPNWSPFYSNRNKKIWTWYLALITFLLFFFFAAGYGSFSYNQTPLDAGAMNFAEDFTISVRMIWQTYPLVWMLLGILVAVLIFRWMYHLSHWQVINATDGQGIPHRRSHFLYALLLALGCIHGSFSFRSLDRTDSFRFSRVFLSYLAINPVQNFVATLGLRNATYDEYRARSLFPVMKKWIGLPSGARFDFKRTVGPRSTAFESRPNIVLVQCESFSMYKSTMSGNPLNTTPFFDSLCSKGIFFERCFSPTFSTARALFAILTGIPDAQFFKFSSRNPSAIDQYTLISELDDYEKHYFLGGDAGFNNFEGILKNIPGLQMHTGESFSTPPINVWGISDKDLFAEANKRFSQSTAPFFAYIQTAGNHRPFQRSISPADIDFKRDTLREEILQQNGFESLDEYNAFRYSDYCIRSFMNAAAKQPYYNNTIFVFVGDHGVAGNAQAVYPPLWTEQRLTDLHVPLLFYAPGLLAPQRRTEVVSQIDVLPTIAGLLHRSYQNRTLGRDLLDPNTKEHFAFVTNATDKIGIITNDYYLVHQVNTGEEELLPLSVANDTLRSADRLRLQRSLSELAIAFFETSRYLILNNKK